MCTAILTDYPGGSVMGRTMDFETPLDYHVLYLPKGYRYADDLDGNHLTSKYDMLGLCFSDLDPLKDGVNEHGLAGCTNMFITINTFGSKTDPGKINLSSLDYFNYALGNYKSVKELKEDLDNIRISTKNADGEKVICPEFHFYFVDEHGDSVVVEPVKKKLTAIDNPYRVLTNSPSFSSQVRRLKRFFGDDPDSFNGAKHLPGGYDPVSRFIKAWYLNRYHIPARNGAEAMEQVYSVLEAMKLPEGFIKNEQHDYYTYTRYTCAYDTKNRLMTVRSHRNPEIFSLSIDDMKEVDVRTLIDVPQRIELNPIF